MKQKNYLLEKTKSKLITYKQKLKDFPENQIFKLKIDLLEIIKDYIMENMKDEK